LLHVSSANKFGAEIKVLPVGLLQIQDDVVVSFLQVTLIRVEDDGLLTKQLSNWIIHSPRQRQLICQSVTTFSLLYLRISSIVRRDMAGWK
jgi:hypothetical protein